MSSGTGGFCTSRAAPPTEWVRPVLQRLEGGEALVAGLLYGSGLRL
ncbi:MAG: hypothetical protein R6U00_06620 [Prochlorococcaceae cyanobacterium]